jgi:hypothetical protein
LCKPEDPSLALAQKENKLALAWLHKFDGEKKIPIDPISTLSEHHVSNNDMDMLRLTASYSWIRLEPSRLKEHKSRD